MKLYTEEQVRKAINDASLYSYINGDFEFKNSEDDIVNSLIPIELPTDEEIKEYSLHYSEMQEDVSDKIGKYLVKAVHMDGANWVINKIQGGNQ